MPETDRKWNSAENKYKALVTQRCFMFGSSDTDFKIRNRNLLTIRQQGSFLQKRSQRDRLAVDPVVDVEPMNIFVVKEMLKKKGLDSVAATRGIEVFNMIEDLIESFLL